MAIEIKWGPRIHANMLGGGRFFYSHPGMQHRRLDGPLVVNYVGENFFDLQLTPGDVTPFGTLSPVVPVLSFDNSTEVFSLADGTTPLPGFQGIWVQPYGPTYPVMAELRLVSQGRDGPNYTLTVGFTRPVEEDDARLYMDSLVTVSQDGTLLEADANLAAVVGSNKYAWKITVKEQTTNFRIPFGLAEQVNPYSVMWTKDINTLPLPLRPWAAMPVFFAN